LALLSINFARERWHLSAIKGEARLEMVFFEKMFALRAKDRYYLDFGILSLVGILHKPENVVLLYRLLTECTTYRG